MQSYAWGIGKWSCPRKHPVNGRRSSRIKSYPVHYCTTFSALKRPVCTVSRATTITQRIWDILAINYPDWAQKTHTHAGGGDLDFIMTLTHTFVIVMALPTYVAGTNLRRTRFPRFAFFTLLLLLHDTTPNKQYIITQRECIMVRISVNCKVAPSLLFLLLMLLLLLLLLHRLLFNYTLQYALRSHPPPSKLYWVRLKNR